MGPVRGYPSRSVGEADPRASKHLWALGDPPNPYSFGHPLGGQSRSIRPTSAGTGSSTQPLLSLRRRSAITARDQQGAIPHRRRQRACEPGYRDTELKVGLEPTTGGLQNRCSTKLSYSSVQRARSAFPRPRWAKPSNGPVRLFFGYTNPQKASVVVSARGAAFI